MTKSENCKLHLGISRHFLSKGSSLKLWSTTNLCNKLFTLLMLQSQHPQSHFNFQEHERLAAPFRPSFLTYLLSLRHLTSGFQPRLAFLIALPMALHFIFPDLTSISFCLSASGFSKEPWWLHRLHYLWSLSCRVVLMFLFLPFFATGFLSSRNNLTHSEVSCLSFTTFCDCDHTWRDWTLLFTGSTKLFVKSIWQSMM